MKSYDRDAGEVKSEFVLKMATQSRQSADPFYPKFSVFFSNFELYTAISIKIVHEQSGKVESRSIYSFTSVNITELGWGGGLERGVILHLATTFQSLINLSFP